jgi:hypothetical protein
LLAIYRNEILLTLDLWHLSSLSLYTNAGTGRRDHRTSATCGAPDTRCRTRYKLDVVEVFV